MSSQTELEPQHGVLYMILAWRMRLKRRKTSWRGCLPLVEVQTSSGLGIRVKLPQGDLSHTFHYSLRILGLGERLRSYDLHTTTLGHCWSSHLTSNNNNFISVIGMLNLRFEELYWSKRIDQVLAWVMYSRPLRRSS